MEQIKLTQFSPGAGCGCKISPRDLEAIIKPTDQIAKNPNLLVGYQSKDDAAVYDIGGGKAIISTTDFFTPIVDDPFNFGRIAAVNAISDIYAMGGKPLMAVSILGWPLEKLAKEMAGQVIEGARKACSEAECELAGGHSISISDPIFGLAVTGIIDKKFVKQNDKATEDCRLFLTKPLGVGLISTAQKHGIASEEHLQIATNQMCTLNKLGMAVSEIPDVVAMTDVTGFGLLGHLLEICEGSNVNAEINFEAVPVIKGIEEYISKKAIPGGTHRNWKSYGEKVELKNEEYKNILCDPQTSGGLLIAVKQGSINTLMETANKNNTSLFEVGFTKKKENQKTWVKVM
jgi:selenide,water dikinase